MFGFGPRLGQVFASRWKALIWALGILLTAYCTVPAADQRDGTVAKPDKTAAAKPPHKSPWARD